MKPAVQPPEKKVGLSPVLFLIIFGIIIAAILAFLILRPNPRNSSLLLPANPATITESLPILTGDRHFQSYAVKLIW